VTVCADKGTVMHTSLKESQYCFCTSVSTHRCCAAHTRRTRTCSS